jgi:hypothetical protein
MKFYTYLWFREDGTPYYVGKGRGKRAYTNVGHAVRRPKERSRIFVQCWESEEKAFEMEKWYISFFGRKDLGTGILRNMTDGGDGPSGWVPTEETKTKISKSLMGHVISEETRAKQRTARKLRVFTEEMRKSMSAAQKGRKCPWVAIRNKENPTFLGRKHTEETKQKMRSASTGRKCTEESKEKNRQAHLGRKDSEETRQKKSENSKRMWKLRKSKQQENQNGIRNFTLGKTS